MDRVRRAIEGVAGSRVRELGVAWEDGALILTGQSPSQHVKQLVQESAMGSLDRRIALVNRIRVRS